MPSQHPAPDTARTDPRRSWRIPDDRRLPALEPLASAVERHEPVSLRETVWDSDERVLAAEGVTLTRAQDGSWSLDHGDGPVPVGADLDRPNGEQPPRDGIEVFLRGRAMATVRVRDTTTTLVTLRGKDGRVRAEIADVRVDEGDPDTSVLRSARWWALSDDGRDGTTARAAERALDDAATEPPATSAVAVPPAPVLAPERRGNRTKRPRSGTAAAFVLRVLESLRADLVAVDPRVRADDHESVHDFRKVVRRLRSVLAAYRGALDREATEALRAALAEAGRVAGVARDAEVLHGGLFRSAARAPEGFVDAPTLDRIGEQAAALRSAAAAELRQALRSDDWFRTLDALDQLLLRAPAGPHADDAAAAFVAKRIDRERARVRRLVDGGAAGLDVLHEIRKAARRLRYALEAAGDVADLGKRRLSRLRRVQETLGDALDAAHAADAYRRLSGPAARDGADTFGYGALTTAEHAVLERGLRRSRKVLARL
ncbi:MULTISPECIES: CHAD domain-containing protein [unclassified Curtobacterium]|uniref:CHAD domain-containing protein n=1 Tax=unclassified Curtobacterium TaxID=257496 RepID=UPI0010472B07|nr:MULTISPECIES: CHAD domain-containing protein [unclassified Curtobacterium]TCL77309.1 CHAD domain-containing protein [Curtobacterium sp. PhB128]TCL93267.1 CHAD domain-containing protein [Curtobacterium sp. PhB138]